ncbi:MAG: hypothetical protein M0Z30_06775 [Actinomycetota bacterium]|nr:hypothetical protein [Actinomycetota bacterium]
MTSTQHEFDTYEDLVESYFERGWTDGLPVMAPTPAKVQSFLDHAGLDADAVIGTVPTREVVATAELVAINAVMAGCRAEYFPVVVAAVRAHLSEKGNCHSTTGTLSGAAQMVVVNGPARLELDINCRAGCMGPGWRANATIGRALRLVIRNVCRAVPNFLDRASFSTPARYSFCIGENEEDSPWIPLHVERGFAAGTSTVTVQSAMHVVAAGDSVSRTPEGILDSVNRTLRQTGSIGDRWLGEDTNIVLVVGMEHMRYFAGAGWSKQQMREYLWPRLQAPPGAGERTVNLGKPEGLLIVAAGGPGMAQTWAILPHLAWAITEPVQPSVGRV